jgi:hypothetical protein
MNDFDEEEEEFESGDFGATSGVVPPQASSATPASTPLAPAAGMGLDDSFEDETMEESGSVPSGTLSLSFFSPFYSPPSNTLSLVSSPPHSVSSPVHVHSSTPPLPPQIPAQAPAPANGNAQVSNGNAQVNLLVRSRFREEIRARVKPYVLDLLKYLFSPPN